MIGLPTLAASPTLGGLLIKSVGDGVVGGNGGGLDQQVSLVGLALNQGSGEQVKLRFLKGVLDLIRGQVPFGQNYFVA